MRDEKEERKKQARSNKQRRQSNTAYPRQSLFRAASGGTRTHDTLYSRHVYILYAICLISDSYLMWLKERNLTRNMLSFMKPLLSLSRISREDTAIMWLHLTSLSILAASCCCLRASFTFLTSSSRTFPLSPACHIHTVHLSSTIP